jgi:molybdopterin-binding protein
VGIAFQGRRLFPHLSALRNVAFPLEALGTPRAAAERSARDCLARVDGLALAEAPPDRLSGGESQRVALARALVAEPRLLLLDEPFAALDAGARSRLRALLRRLFADFDGIALVVSHDAVDALTLATTVVVIEAGCTVASGSPRDLRLRPPNAFAADLVGLNYFVGNLERVEPGVGALHTAEGSLIVALPPDAAAIPGTQTTAVLSPAAVSLHRARPEGSARNVLAGEIEAVHLDAFRARVRLASAPPVVAEITPASVERLGLEEGTHVWASFKAVEVRLLDAGDHA